MDWFQVLAIIMGNVAIFVDMRCYLEDDADVLE